MAAAAEVADKVGIKAACKAMTVARATFYRRQRPPEVPKAPRKGANSSCPRALSEMERRAALEVLRSERLPGPNGFWCRLYVILEVLSR